VLGVDVGTVRVGVAVSDPDRLVATPLDTVPGGDDLAVRLVRLAAEEACDTVVVGLPRALSGRDTDSTRVARTVADGVRAAGLRVELWDERLSSAEAERVLLIAGRRRAQRRTERDRVAATIILQGWLDARRTTE
jgi:putative Holliday junction resolvase